MSNFWKKIVLVGTFLFAGCFTISCSIVDSNSGNGTSSNITTSTTLLDANSTPERVVIHEGEDVNIIATGTATTVTTADVVDAVANSVVEIVTEVVTTGNFMQQYVSSGAGSGVIINENGYIITNHHVIDGASSITVNLRDQTSYTASLIASDANNDIAVIKITTTSTLKYAVIGDSTELRVGTEVLAIGNPLGELGGSVTKGIISALDRQVVIDNVAMTLLQIDAAINPGNSGGGLFNMNGQLIGIVNAKSTGEDIDGIGFAIPSKVAMDTFEDLVQYGYVKGRVTMGMTIVSITDSFTLHYYGLTYKGLYVSTIDKTNANEFKNKDYLKTIDGKSVTSLGGLSSLLKNYEVGDIIKVEVVRGNSTLTISLTLIEDIPS